MCRVSHSGFPPFSCGPKHDGKLTVERDSNFGVVPVVGNLPDVKSLVGRVGQEAEEHDDGVGRGKTVGVDLPVSVENV